MNNTANTLHAASLPRRLFLEPKQGGYGFSAWVSIDSETVMFARTAPGRWLPNSEDDVLCMERLVGAESALDVLLDDLTSLLESDVVSLCSRAVAH